MKKLSFAVLAVLVLAGCTKQTTQTDETKAARQPSRTMEASQSARPSNTPNENGAMGQTMKEADYRFKLAGLETPKREGWVTLTAMGAKTKVTIEMMDTTATGAAKKASASPSASTSAIATMPAHIHLGSCPKPGEVKYSLKNVVNGTSVTEVAASVDQIMALGALSVNVHKSAAELSKYVACGNLDFKAEKAEKEGTGSGKMKSALPSVSTKASPTVRASATPRASAQ